MRVKAQELIQYLMLVNMDLEKLLKIVFMINIISILAEY